MRASQWKKIIAQAVGGDPNFRADSAEVGRLALSLQAIEAQPFNVQDPAMQARLVLPLRGGVNPGATTYAYEQWDRVGVAKRITDYANDLPRVDVSAKKFVTPIQPYGASWGLSDLEIAGALFSGHRVDEQKSVACRTAIEQKIDQVLRLGDSARGITGLLNNAAVPVLSAPDGVSASSAWVDKTPDEIVQDVTLATAQIRETTKLVEYPDTMLLPTAQYQHIANTRMGDGSDTTILTYLLRNNPYIKQFVEFNGLEGIGGSGTDRAMLYRKSVDKIYYVLPMDFVQMPPERRNLSQIFNCVSSTAGVIFPYPLSALYLDGI